MRSIGMPWTRQLSSTSLKPSSQTTSSTADDGTAKASKGMTGRSRRYHWVDEEAEKLIAVAYRLHLPDRPFPPSVGFDTARLEGMRALPHFEPKTLSDRVALRVVKVMEQFMHLFFREKYDHHAVTLETVAAVPGFLAAVHRHMRSLRRMKRDHGWIDALLEEATNERMHLLIWMQMTQPNAIERMFVLFAQGAYIAAYSSLYFVSPKTAHRSVGYLEEAAFRAYTDYLKAVDSGAIPNRPLAANSIAKKFYRLPEGATLRDVILHVRADEAFHALYNHAVSTQIHEGRVDEGIVAPGEQEVERASQQNNATGSQ